MFNFHELLEMDTYEVSPSKEPTKKLKPWVDKYRPKKLDDIVAQDEVTKILKSTLKTGTLPHLLLYGPPGTGKTSTVLAMARELFGPKKFKDRVIELNASDERGINVVRTKIVTFAKTAVGTADPNYPSPPYKIIILDEADAMTTEAQSALRKTMENNANITRFCFICNYDNQIIDPIVSRCVKFRFKSLDDKAIYDKLKAVADGEKLNLEKGVIQCLVKISEGDLRKAIMLLQNMKYMQEYDGKITLDAVYEMASWLSDKMLKRIRKGCIVKKNVPIMQIVKLTKEIRAYGYPINNIIRQLHEMIVNEPILTDKMKAQICLHFAKTETRLIEGADEYLQLLSILMCIYSVSHGVSTIHVE